MDTSKEFEDWAESVIDNIAVEAGLESCMLDARALTIEQIASVNAPEKHTRLRRMGASVMKFIYDYGDSVITPLPMLDPNGAIYSPRSV